MDELEAATARMTLEQATWLQSEGLDVAARRVVGPVGRGYVVPSVEDTFEWCEEGDEGLNAIVVGVWDQSYVWAAEAVRRSDPSLAPALIDLVAFDPRNPQRWLRRLGTATWLGEWEVDSRKMGALATIEPLPLYPTPLDWLHGGGAGACLLDWKRVYLREKLEGLGAIVAFDPMHAAALKEGLRRKRPQPPLPKILLKRETG